MDKDTHSQKIAVPSTRYHKIMNLLSLLFLASSFLYLIINWGNIPQEIPTHYSFSGKADAWGGKGALWFPVILSLILYLLMTLTEHFPGIWNTGVKITSYNKNWVYLNLKNMIITMKCIMTANFFYLTWASANGRNIGFFYMLIFFVVLFGPMTYFLIRTKRVPPHEESQAKDFDIF